MNSIIIIYFILILLNIKYCLLIHPVICNIELLCLVSDDWCWVSDASSAPGVICFFVHYCYFIEVDSKCPDEIKVKTKIIPFCPGNKMYNKNEFSEFMKKPDTYTQTKEISL